MASDQPDDLLREARWLECLALGLVGDAHAAADLAQDAWLAAERAAPVGRRAWFVATLRKLASKAHRQRGRLQRREQLAARAEALPSAAELTERAEQHQRLIGHIKALAEPYRVVVLLRYYEGLPPREIAARLRVPVRTVHTRLQRALEQLRARLDAEHPRGRAGWVGALLLGRVPRAPVGASSVAAACAVVSVAVAAAWWWTCGLGSEEPPQHDETAAAASVAPEPTQEPQRERHEVDTPTAPMWSGTVVDVDGYPLPGATIEVVPHLGLRFDGGDDETLELLSGPARALQQPSDGRGSFAAPRPESAVLVRAQRPGWATALAAVWRPGQTESPCVVMARARDVACAVVDPQGHPLVGVQARLVLHAQAVAMTQHPLDRLGVSDANGWLRLSAVPQLPGAVLELRHPGYLALRCELAELRGDQLTMSVDPAWRRAVVRDARDMPLAGVQVVVAGHLAVSDARGEFAAPLVEGSAVGLAAANCAPMLVRCEGAAFSPRLGAAAVELSGVLCDAQGRPADGYEVSLADPTVAGSAARPRVLESLVAGRGGFVLLARTDAAGRFRLPGLAPRPYRLRVVDPRTAAQFVTSSLQPGVVARVTVPGDLLHPELRGRLTTGDGMPLAGASVGVQAHGYVVPAPPGGVPATLFSHGSSTLSDADGRFVLRDVPRAEAWLRVDHPDTRRAELAVPQQLDATPLVSVVPRWSQLSVHCRAAADLDAALELLDARGEVLAMRTLGALAERSVRAVALRRGFSPLLTVPEGAAAVRVRAGGRELAQARLDLRPGGRAHIEL